jgi:hypothetical protein
MISIINDIVDFIKELIEIIGTIGKNTNPVIKTQYKKNNIINWESIKDGDYVSIIYSRGDRLMYDSGLFRQDQEDEDYFLIDYSRRYSHYNVVRVLGDWPKL